MQIRCQNTVLGVASLGFFAITLNWFAMSAYFPHLAAQDHIGPGGISLLVASFLAGYGIWHIPAGMWVRRYGLRATVVLGLMIESLASGVDGWVHGMLWLIFLRFVAGGAAALVLGGDLAWVTKTFRHRQLVLALGISASGAYSLGALLGLQWPNIMAPMGPGLSLSGALGIAIALAHVRFMTPSDHRGTPAEETWSALRRVMKNRQLLWVGFGAMGGYGTYFTLTQLGPAAMVSSTHLSLHFSEILPTILVALGIPGSLLGGYWANRSWAKKWFILGPSLGLALVLFFMPYTPDVLQVLLFALGGFAVMVARPAYTAFPGHADPPHRHPRCGDGRGGHFYHPRSRRSCFPRSVRRCAARIGEPRRL